MSRLRTKAAKEDIGFPRVSGDEPPLIAHIITTTAFSPRERG